MSITLNSFDDELDKILWTLVHAKVMPLQAECEFGKISPVERNERANAAIAEAKQAVLTHHNAEYKKLVTKRAAHYTEDGLVADALDPWAVPVSAIEDLIKEPTNGE